MKLGQKCGQQINATRINFESTDTSDWNCVLPLEHSSEHLTWVKLENLYISWQDDQSVITYQVIDKHLAHGLHCSNFKNACTILLPSHVYGYLEDIEEYRGCMLPHGHDEEHLCFLTNINQFVMWSSPEKLCEECPWVLYGTEYHEDTGECSCIDSWKPPFKEGQELLAQSWKRFK